MMVRCLFHSIRPHRLVFSVTGQTQPLSSLVTTPVSLRTCTLRCTPWSSSTSPSTMLEEILAAKVTQRQTAGPIFTAPTLLATFSCMLEVSITALRRKTRIVHTSHGLEPSLMLSPSLLRQESQSSLWSLEEVRSIALLS